MKLIVPPHLEQTVAAFFSEYAENQSRITKILKQVRTQIGKHFPGFSWSQKSMYESSGDVFAGFISEDTLAQELAVSQQIEAPGSLMIASPIYWLADLHSAYITEISFKTDWQEQLVKKLEEGGYFEWVHPLAGGHLLLHNPTEFAPFKRIPVDLLGQKIVEHYEQATSLHRLMTEMQMLLHALWEGDQNYPNGLWFWDLPRASVQKSPGLFTESQFWQGFSDALEWKLVDETADLIYLESDAELIEKLQDPRVDSVEVIRGNSYRK